MLDHMVVLVFQETAVLFSTVAVPVYIPTNNVLGFPFLYTLVNVCYLWVFLMVVILTDVKRYLVVLICISIMISND